VKATDYVARPASCRAEINADTEVHVSLGEYVNGADVWASFSLLTAHRPSRASFADQPSPYKNAVGRLWNGRPLDGSRRAGGSPARP